jgi:hypothetical protein
MASYRYRAAIPACELGVSLNDLSADILVFCKPQPAELDEVIEAKMSGKVVVVDFCDDHFDLLPYYREFALESHFLTAPTEEMARRIILEPVEVIPDPYEFPEAAPHCDGIKLLWFGHSVNFSSLLRALPSLNGYPLQVVSNVEGTMPWSHKAMLEQFAKADIVVLPAVAPHKSCNRAVEAVRQGCFVVAEPHPSLEEFAGIWIGDIKEGVEWTRNNLKEASERTREAQRWVQSKFSPATQASAWKSLFEKARSPSSSEVERSSGRAGSTSTVMTSAQI